MTLHGCTDFSDVDSNRTVYHIELSENTFVDVMCVRNSGLLYVMQNSDGSYVFGPDGTSVEQSFDEAEIMAFVRKMCLGPVARQ